VIVLIHLDMRFLSTTLLSLACLGPISAKEPKPPTLKMANGKTITGNPLRPTNNVIYFGEAEPPQFHRSLDQFAPDEQVKLKKWAAAMKCLPQFQLQQRAHNSDQLRILFIGNSYSFKIPKLFAQVAKREGKNVIVEQTTRGGWQLAKHAQSPKTLDPLTKNKWDIVVIQEQSQVPAFPEAQRAQLFYPAAKQLAKITRDNGAIPIFFETWGRRDGDKQNAKAFPNDTFEAMQKRLTSGYRTAASKAGNAYVVPVGSIWAESRKLAGGLYSIDGSHPNATGNYLGACVFYTAIFNKIVKNPNEKIKQANELVTKAYEARLKPLPYPLPEATK